MSENTKIIEFRKLPNDDTKIIVTFNAPEDYVSNGSFYVPKNTNMGSEVAASYGLDHLILKKGIYPLSFLYNEKGETVVNLY